MKRSSVRPSIGLSHRSKSAAVCGRFAAERPADRWRYRSDAEPRACSRCAVLRAPCSRRRRSAANAGSITLTADVGGSRRTYLLICWRFCHHTSDILYNDIQNNLFRFSPKLQTCMINHKMALYYKTSFICYSLK